MPLQAESGLPGNHAFELTALDRALIHVVLSQTTLCLYVWSYTHFLCAGSCNMWSSNTHETRIEQMVKHQTHEHQRTTRSVFPEDPEEWETNGMPVRVASQRAIAQCRLLQLRPSDSQLVHRWDQLLFRQFASQEHPRADFLGCPFL